MTRTAVHEAGHAVLGLSLGIRIKHATIEPNAEGKGEVAFFGPLPDDCDELAALFLAGFVAEQIAFDNDATLSGDDLEYAHALTSDPTHPLRDNMESASLLPARILTSRWVSVLAIAAALEQEKTLTGDEIEALLTGLTDDEKRLVEPVNVLRMRAEMHSIVDMLCDGLEVDDVAELVTAHDDEYQKQLLELIVWYRQTLNEVGRIRRCHQPAVDSDRD